MWKYFKEFVHPDDLRSVNQYINEIVDIFCPGKISELKFKIIRKDGNMRDIHTQCHFSKDIDGKITIS
ncbi:PAS domain-containing protein [Methanospirillum lacunae]|uniref:PAS domain-containing protein n=1 Tax=Methanospirillum lacunae TaxID=668570 RepID=UPI0038FC0A2F